MSNTFWTSDLHWNHQRIQEFTQRPWDVNEQEDAIVEIWNNQVKPGDSVYHLGDWSFSPTKETKPEFLKRIMKRLNGNIFFIVGNHDSANALRELYKEFGGRVLGVEYFAHMRINKKRITMCHFPLIVWENSHHGYWSLYGHCHGSYEHPGKALDVGIDNSIKVVGEYRLFEFDDIKEYMDKREPWCPDHHNRGTT